MKYLMCLALATASLACINSPFYIRQAAREPSTKDYAGNVAQAHNNNLINSLNHSLERQEKLDRSNDLYMPMKP